MIHQVSIRKNGGILVTLHDFLTECERKGIWEVEGRLLEFTEHHVQGYKRMQVKWRQCHPWAIPFEQYKYMLTVEKGREFHLFKFNTLKELRKGIEHALTDPNEYLTNYYEV